jgi:nitrogen fixation NifU-like protein
MAIDPSYLREIIMDHYEYPRNKSLVENDDAYLSRHMSSESCIDDITVQAKIEKGHIEDVRFDGVACTISTAATDIMSDLLKDKSIEEAQTIIDNYFSMIDQNDFDEDLLEEAVALQNVGKQANRIKCATIGWNAMKEIIDESKEKSNE